MRVRYVILGAILALSATVGGAQIKLAHTGPGWEAFEVTYVGGDTRYPKKQYGVLVLTDSTIAIHECIVTGECVARKNGDLFKSPAKFTIPLRSVKDVVKTEQRRAGGGTGLGADHVEARITITYATANSAESPIFDAISREHATVVETKLRARLEKLGVKIPDKK